MSKGITIFLVVIFFQSCNSARQDTQQIRKCFAEFKTAILTHDGKKGVECVDSATLNFYSEILRKTIKFDSLQIENEPPIDKLTILKIRQNATKDSIMQMDKKSLLLFLINKGKAGNLNIGEFELGNIKIDNDTAIAENIINGKPTQFIYKFYKEKNGWKFSMFSPREQEIYNFGLRHSISESKLSEDAYILHFIETTSDSRLKNNIWHPLKISKGG